MAFRRWRAEDVRSILAAGAGTPQPRLAGDALVIDLPRSRSGRCRTTRSGARHDRRRVPALAADLDAGLRRLKLAAMRRLAPELMVTAKTQRWSPEEFLRTLLDAEMTSRDESNARARMKAAAFPVIKTIAEFDVARPRCRRPPSTTSPRWSGSGPRRTTAPSARPAPASRTASSRSASPPSKPATRSATSPPPSLSRPSTAAWPTTPSAASSRPSCAQRPGHHRRGRVRPAGRHGRPAAVPVRRRGLRAPRPRHRLPLALRPVGPLPARAHHRRQPARPAPAPRRRRGHRRRIVPHAPGPSQDRRTPSQNLKFSEGWRLLSGHQPPRGRADPAPCSFPPAVLRREVPSLSAEHLKPQ